MKARKSFSQDLCVWLGISRSLFFDNPEPGAKVVRGAKGGLTGKGRDEGIGGRDRWTGVEKRSGESIVIVV